MANQRDEKAKILVIDDSEVILEMTGLLLRSAGYQVVTMSTALGTCERIIREKPDLVLLDVSMPAISGDQIVEVVKKSDRLRNTIVVLYSDRPENELRQIMHRCQADGYIQKTSNSNRLLSQIGAWVCHATSDKEKSPSRR